jgi:anti-sigma factor RsiW
MTHLGQRLSALIDEELDAAERDRVLMHVAKCDACRSEVIALRTLKRRMSALGGEAAADGALTRKLMGLVYADEGRPHQDGLPATGWPRLAGMGQGSAAWPQARPSWYFGAGAIAVFLAGLGTAVFMAGGGQELPAPKVTPAVDVYYTQHEYASGVRPAGPGPAYPGAGRSDARRTAAGVAQIVPPASNQLLEQMRALHSP